MESWSLMLSRELEGTGITVNIELPGRPVNTQMVLDGKSLDRRSQGLSNMTQAFTKLNRD